MKFEVPTVGLSNLTLAASNLKLLRLGSFVQPATDYRVLASLDIVSNKGA